MGNEWHLCQSSEVSEAVPETGPGKSRVSLILQLPIDGWKPNLYTLYLQRQIDHTSECG